MTLQQLEYIIAVESLGSFTKAAEQCRVTQPTLSAMIQKLEDELEVRIFERSKSPVTPTSTGRLIIEQAHVVLVQAQKVKDIVSEEKQTITVQFNVGILPTIAPYLLPRFLPHLMNKYPKLDIRVRDMKTHEIKAALLSGDIDAGILADLDGLSEYNCYSLFYEQFYAYVAETNPLHDKSTIKTTDLLNQELWLLDEGHCFRDQIVKFCQLKNAQSSKLAYNLSSMETFMRMVESGKGVTFIPELATMQMGDCHKKLVKPFAIPTPTRHIIIATNRNFVRNTILNMVIDEIKASVPKDMHKLKNTQIAI